MKIIYKEGEGEIEEKKSRFIAHVYPVQSEEQAVSYINPCLSGSFQGRTGTQHCAFGIGRGSGTD